MAHYQLFKKIAKGGMAEIYLAKQIGEDGFQRVCCIKRILPHYTQDKEFIEMFRDEAHIGKRLQHANIVRIEGFEEVEGSFGIVMEFVDGGDLRAILSACERKSRQLSIPMALYIAAESARGLHFAHTKVDDLTGKSMDIVHRDISPQNILVSFEGEVKVTDFGIADAENKEAETRPGIVKGKYAYMSPEQISAKPLDARTDVFALSVVLWETLAMRRLFSGENDVETIDMVKQCRMPGSLREFNQRVDEELEAIILKGLKKDLRERYANGAAFEKDLRRYISQHEPDFTPDALGQFLKIVLEERRQESQANLKELLSQSRQNFGVTQGGAATKLMTGTISNTVGIATPTIASQPSSVPLSPSSLGGHSSSPSSSAPSFRGGNGSALNKRTHQGTQISGTAYHTHSTKSFGRSSSSSFIKTLFMIFFWVGLLGGVGFFVSQKFQPQKISTHFEIRTTPSTVKLTIDGKPVQNGAYIKTPYTFKKIPKGTHTLMIYRNGFNDESMTIDLKGEQTDKTQDDVVLNKAKNMAPIRLSFKYKESQEYNNKVQLVIDDGIESEITSPKKELNLESITFGEKHMLTVQRPDGSLSFICQFTPRSENWTAPFLILINLKEKNCQYPAF